MAFTIIREDLARVEVDAIVVPSNTRLSPDGGVALTVAKAAGYRRVKRACKRLGGCAVGQAAATPAFKLQAQHIIHAVGPVWRGGSHGEQALLRQAYESALLLAWRLNAQSVALPLLSAGTYGYPVREAFEVAVETIRAFLADADLDVMLVLFDKQAVLEGSCVMGEIAELIDDAYVAEHAPLQSVSLNAPQRRDRVARETVEESALAAPQASAPGQSRCPRCGSPFGEDAAFCIWCGHRLDADEAPRLNDAACRFSGAADYTGSILADLDGTAGNTGGVPADPNEPADYGAPVGVCAASSPRPVSMPVLKRDSPIAPDLGDLLARMDEPFSAMLLKLIDARGLTDAQVYKRANITRQHFSKMRKPGYKPTKKTVLALAVALELSPEETADLLARAGFALTRSSKFDIIVGYFIERGDYDIFAINEALFAYDQPLLE